MSGIFSRLFRHRVKTTEPACLPSSSDEGLASKGTAVVQVRQVALAMDDAAILAVAARIAANDAAELAPDELAIVAALRRAHPSAGQSPEELGSWLAGMDADQLQGVVSNTKGVLHEMRFVELENADGDSVHAAQFAATNHPGFDVSFVDDDAGERWAAQLKATDSGSYVREWLEKYPGGEILVTSEVADRLGIKGSGLSNEELTADTSSLVDHLVRADEQDALWDYLPALGALSVAIVIAELHGRASRGEITREQFDSMVARATGQRVARTLGLGVLMAIPGVNVLAAIGLVASNLERSGYLEKANDWLARKSAQMDATRAYEEAVSTERIAIESAIETANLARETEKFLSGKPEAYRQRYVEARRKAEVAIRDSDGSPVQPEVLRYEEPDQFLPDPGVWGRTGHMIEDKLARVRAERYACLGKARLYLRDPANSAAFRRSLQELVGTEGAASLERAIAEAG